MVFSSTIFLFFFLPLTLLAYFVVGPRGRNAILLAARGEFAEHGLGGARMDRIAERAGLNKRLIYYYFSGKESLFQAALEQFMGQVGF